MNVLQVTINLTDQAAADNLSGATTTFGTFFESLLSGIMLIAALMVLFFLVWGAIEWITAGGDQSKIQKGRDRIVQSIIGIIVLASTLALFGLVQSFLGLEILNFGSPVSPRRTRGGIPVCAPGATGAPGGGPCISPD